MSFVSGIFLIFLPIVCVGYYLIPHRFRYLWLLAASYYFYMGWNAKYALLILASTVITYACSIGLETIKDKVSDEKKQILYKKWCVAASLIANLGILAYFKYAQFTLDTFNNIISIFGIKTIDYHFDILLPVGISFYTFQALGYTIDVYRDQIKAEKNFFKYALFVSFFPQLVAGPIERSKNLLKQFDEVHKFSFVGFEQGIVMMLWGYFLKIVISDRLALIADNIYANYQNYPGWYLIVATVFFTIQIYCDFNGYTMIARGAAKIMGFNLMVNFDAPFLSTSIATLWRRWHISLTSWFVDYLYIPLGGSRRGKIRKYINIVIVFMVSGLWHGASMSYVMWGLLNGLYQVIGDALMPIRKKVREICHIDINNIGTILARWFVTICLFEFAAIFFRAPSLHDAFAIVKSVFTTHNAWILFDGSLYGCGLSQKSFWMAIFAIMILFISGLLRRFNVSAMSLYMKQDPWFKVIFISAFTLFILIFGMYGPAYDASSFIYFQF